VLGSRIVIERHQSFPVPFAQLQMGVEVASLLERSQACCHRAGIFGLDEDEMARALLCMSLTTEDSVAALSQVLGELSREIAAALRHVEDRL
jgi:hypothetical protein